MDPSQRQSILEQARRAVPEVSPKEAGGSPRHLSDIVLGVVRNGKLVRVDEAEVDALELGDRLLYVRSADAER